MKRARLWIWRATRLGVYSLGLYSLWIRHFVIFIVTVIVIDSVIVAVTDMMCLLVHDEPSWRSEYTSLSTC